MESQDKSSSVEVQAAWRLLLLNWIMIAGMGAALLLGLVVTDFSIGLSGLAIAGGYVALYAGFAHANARSPTRRDPQVMFVLGGIAQIVLITALMTPLTYVAASADWPMQDANLLAIDRALGFDWKAYVGFVNDHPTLAAWLDVGYAMIRWPIFAIPLVLAAKHYYRRVAEFTFAFGAALIVSTIISAFVPALGIYATLHDPSAVYPHIAPSAYFESLRELPLVRDGSLRHLEPLNLSGLVTFPSFHAASAVLYLWALWPVRWIRPIAIVANGLMLASCPPFGAHYAIDLFAGIAVAMMAIAVACKVSRAVEGNNLRTAATLAAVAVAPSE